MQRLTVDRGVDFTDRLATREVLGSNIRLYTRLGYEIVSRAPHEKWAGMVVEKVKRL